MSSGHGGSEKASCEFAAANVVNTRKKRRPFPKTPDPGADEYLCSFTLEADERKIRERGEATDAPVARHSWLAKQSSADLESEFRDAADETTSLLHRREAAPSRFDTGQFSFRDAAQ